MTGLIIFTILGSPASVKVGTILGVIHLLLDYMKYFQKKLSTIFGLHEVFTKTIIHHASFTAPGQGNCRGDRVYQSADSLT